MALSLLSSSCAGLVQCMARRPPGRVVARMFVLAPANGALRCSRWVAAPSSCAARLSGLRVAWTQARVCLRPRMAFALLAMSSCAELVQCAAQRPPGRVDASTGVPASANGVHAARQEQLRRASAMHGSAACGSRGRSHVCACACEWRLCCSSRAAAPSQCNARLSGLRGARTFVHAPTNGAYAAHREQPRRAGAMHGSAACGPRGRSHLGACACEGRLRCSDAPCPYKVCLSGLRVVSARALRSRSRRALVVLVKGISAARE
jgi:hypothetical protein